MVHPWAMVWLNDAYAMDTTRIVALLKPFLSAPLPAEQLEYISTYIDILVRWNQKLNLTAVRDPEEIVTRHFGESLFAAQLLFGCHVGSNAVAREHASPSPHKSDFAVVDVGSGAGFPGLPLKLCDPALRLTLIESNHKKATFLREVVRALGLREANVSASRAEDFPANSADLVTLRAVERFAFILPTASRLVRPGGRLALFIGQSQVIESVSLTPEFKWQQPVPVPLSTGRVLLIGTRTLGI
jgi:16S rRNA (guanine527-N7)-methyltransferase